MGDRLQSEVFGDEFMHAFIGLSFPFARLGFQTCSAARSVARTERKARRDGRDDEVQISTHDHPAGCGHHTLKGPGGAEMPAAAILAIEHCEPLFAGMGDDDSKTLAGTGRSRRFRLWHLFGCGATDGRLGQIA
jgi:hypothetical protein